MTGTYGKMMGSNQNGQTHSEDFRPIWREIPNTLMTDIKGTLHRRFSIIFEDNGSTKRLLQRSCFLRRLESHQAGMCFLIHVGHHLLQTPIQMDSHKPVVGSGKNFKKKKILHKEYMCYDTL